MRGYRCCSCGNQFIYPKEVDSNVGFRENPHWEVESLCPRCRSGNIEEAELEETEDLMEEMRYEMDMREAEAMWEYYHCM